MSQALWAFVDEAIQSDEVVSLMIVVASEGSSPGQRGFKMAVTASGSRFGTIGGGGMEISCVNKAQRLAEVGEAAVTFDHLIHRREATPAASQSGLICSGSQTVVSLTLLPERRAEIAAILAASKHVERDARFWVSQEGWGLDPDAEDLDAQFEGDAEHFRYSEPLRIPHVVYVMGSGHVGRAVCQALAMCDFYIICFDHREDLDTFRNNPYANEKHCLTSYEEIGEYLVESPNHYAVVATTSYKRDVEALAALSDVDLGFVTLMSSAAKKNQIYNDLREHHDVPPAYIRGIKSPMGLPIKAKTPAEIGIAVAAALVDIRHGGFLGRSM